jgi:pimeloyl-ACP methyl ester carboxylesterase
MSTIKDKSGFAGINNAQIYYETAGEGDPLVMIHAGVADSRQWNNEFAYFAKDFRVLRYDMRGYGKSAPVDGEFSHMQDLARYWITWIFDNNRWRSWGVRWAAVWPWTLP